MNLREMFKRNPKQTSTEVTIPEPVQSVDNRLAFAISARLKDPNVVKMSWVPADARKAHGDNATEKMLIVLDHGTTHITIDLQKIMPIGPRKPVESTTVTVRWMADDTKTHGVLTYDRQQEYDTQK